MVEAARAAMTPLYEQLVLVIEPGMHTARINCVAVDAAERLAVTGSDDKTVRVWSLADGELLQTIRMPGLPRRGSAHVSVRWRSDESLATSPRLKPGQSRLTAQLAPALLASW